jgi:photosystem II stability/assembly factor-like uncharacterized protein
MQLTRRDFGEMLAATALTLPVGEAISASAPSVSWKKMPTAAYKGKQDDIFFINPDIGWYGNGAGKLFHTADGGQSWANVATKEGTFIRALGFIDEKRGFIGNVGTEYYPGVTDTNPLYRTVDGGVSWQAVTAPGIEAVPGICGIDILPVRRIFQGELTTHHVIHAAGRVGGPAMILRSEDGGDTWRVLDLSKDIGMILDVKFHDPLNGFVCASGVSESGEGEAVMLRTADGGKSWNRAYSSGRKMENLWKMSWPSRKVGYATVQSYDENPGNTQRIIIKTLDGGRSWRELRLVNAPKVQQFGVGFVDERRGWVGTRDTGYETQDGGKNWVPIAFGKAVNKIRIARSGKTVRAFAIGVEVHRLDIA